jgi:Rrf2 family transcriptional regulator, iron-sulfur cluster assembly transcription factor
MMHSAACEYAIRAAAHLASAGPEAPVKMREISRREGIPGPFLSALLPRLVAAGVLESVRGPSGGYLLARSAEAISLHDLVVAVDGLDALEACAAGLGRCSDAVPCPLHDAWKPIREGMRSYLKRTTVRDMAAALAVKRARIEARQKNGGAPDRAGGSAGAGGPGA